MPVLSPLVLALLAGLALRVVLAPIDGYPYDVYGFQEWTRQMLSAPLAQFYAAPLDVPQDHLPGDLWLLYGLGRVWEWLGWGIFMGYKPMIALKVVPIAFDLVLAVLAAAMARLVAGEPAGRVALLAILFNPALVFVSSVWGQWNSVSGTLAALSVVAVASWGAPGMVLGLQALAAAALIKPQLLILLLPLAVFVIRECRHRRAWREMLMATAIGGFGSVTLVLAATMPFDVGFPGMGMRWSIVERVRFAADRYDHTTMNAYNLWAWVEPGQSHSDQDALLAGLTYQLAGFLLFGAVIAYALWLLWRWPDAVRGLVVSAAIVTVGLFMVLTRSHERYLMEGLILTVIAASIVPRLRPAAVVLTVGGFINVWSVYGTWYEDGNRIWGGLYPTWWYWTMSTINMIGFALLLWEARPRRHDERAEPVAALTRSGSNGAPELVSAWVERSERELGVVRS